mmetsp:Transcript_12938/g.33707  ORF Transcript_12938/g.33707 Transcript_12938/m.33707 type:complete len:176 (-) Transcript_12938:206-733(-)
MARSGDPLAGLRASHAPENSLGNAIHVVTSSVSSAIGFAVVGFVGGRLATQAVPRISRETRWMIPMLAASTGAILGAQQGTLQALFDVQPAASLAILRRDLEDALVREAQRDAERGTQRSTYVVREQRSPMAVIFGWEPVSRELIVHSNNHGVVPQGDHKPDQQELSSMTSSSSE